MNDKTTRCATSSKEARQEEIMAAIRDARKEWEADLAVCERLAALDAHEATVGSKEASDAAQDDRLPDGIKPVDGISSEAMRAANSLLCDMTGNRQWDVPCAASHLHAFARAAPSSLPVQEPVGQVRTDIERVTVLWFGDKPEHGTMLYTAAPAQPCRDDVLRQANDVRIALVVQLDELCDQIERTLQVFGNDAEARKQAEGAVSFARHVAKPHRYNGPFRTQPAQQATAEPKGGAQ